MTKVPERHFLSLDSGITRNVVQGFLSNTKTKCHCFVQFAKFMYRGTALPCARNLPQDRESRHSFWWRGCSASRLFYSHASLLNRLCIQRLRTLGFQSQFDSSHFFALQKPLARFSQGLGRSVASGATPRHLSKSVYVLLFVYAPESTLHVVFLCFLDFPRFSRLFFSKTNGINLG